MRTNKAESAVTRLRKETAKTRIEVVAVPVGSHVGKTFYQVFRQNLFKFRQSLILEKRQNWILVKYKELVLVTSQR